MPNTAIFEARESNVRMYCRDVPVVFESATGSVLRDEDGKEYIDFFAGAGTLNYGHNDPAMRDAIIEHLNANGIIHGLDLHTVAKRRFLEVLETHLLEPRGWNYKVQFTGPTGTDANEAALKLARKATGRTRIVSFYGSFHGMSAGSLAVSSIRNKRMSGGALSNDVSFVPYESGAYGDFDSLALLERLIEDPRSGTELPAAVIVESVQIQSGVYGASDDWMRRLREITRAHGILLICDEVQAGCGRTGDFFGFERSGIVPDIVTTAKSISGFGLPMSLVLINPDADVWSPGDHTGTFRGNQLAFVGGAVALERWSDPDFTARIAENSAILADAMAAFTELPGVTSTRARGMVAAVDFGLGNEEHAAEIARRALDGGLLVERCGSNDEAVKLMPPLTTPAEQLRTGLDILAAAIREA